MENAFLRWPSSTGPGAALWSAPAEFGMDAEDCMHHNVSGSRHWMLSANLFSMNCSVPIIIYMIYYMCVKMYATIIYSAYLQCVYAHIVHTKLQDATSFFPSCSINTQPDHLNLVRLALQSPLHHPPQCLLDAPGSCQPFFSPLDPPFGTAEDLLWTLQSAKADDLVKLLRWLSGAYMCYPSMCGTRMYTAPKSLTHLCLQHEVEVCWCSVLQFSIWKNIYIYTSTHLRSSEQKEHIGQINAAPALFPCPLALTVSGPFEKKQIVPQLHSACLNSRIQLSKTLQPQSSPQLHHSLWRARPHRHHPEAWRVFCSESNKFQVLSLRRVPLVNIGRVPFHVSCCYF